MTTFMVRLAPGAEAQGVILASEMEAEIRAAEQRERRTFITELGDVRATVVGLLQHSGIAVTEAGLLLTRIDDSLARIRARGATKWTCTLCGAPVPPGTVEAMMGTAKPKWVGHLDPTGIHTQEFLIEWINGIVDAVNELRRRT